MSRDPIEFEDLVFALRSIDATLERIAEALERRNLPLPPRALQQQREDVGLTENHLAALTYCAQHCSLPYGHAGPHKPRVRA